MSQRRITDQEIKELERRIQSGMTTKGDVHLHRAIIDQITNDVRGKHGR